jgi:serine/threonine protein kinase
LKDELANVRNSGEHSCVIKTPFEPNDELFLQELSIHEVFKKEKYFCKLLGFSQDPHHIILKYYKYGSLFYFVFSKTSNSVPVRYSLAISLDLALRITLSFNKMHTKGYIHNDIKLGNILFDEEEKLFPVITDFGITNVLSTASVVSGFKLKILKAGTPEYCAPEVFTSFQNDNIISNVQTDVYSIGIIFIELLTRKKAWKDYKIADVIRGKFPDLSVKKFLDNYGNIKTSIALLMLRLILSCIEYESDKRPSTAEIKLRLEEIINGITT